MWMLIFNARTCKTIIRFSAGVSWQVSIKVNGPRLIYTSWRSAPVSAILYTPHAHTSHCLFIFSIRPACEFGATTTEEQWWVSLIKKAYCRHGIIIRMALFFLQIFPYHVCINLQSLLFLSNAKIIKKDGTKKGCFTCDPKQNINLWNSEMET